MAFYQVFEAFIADVAVIEVELGKVGEIGFDEQFCALASDIVFFLN